MDVDDDDEEGEQSPGDETAMVTSNTRGQQWSGWSRGLTESSSPVARGVDMKRQRHEVGYDG